MYSTRLESSVRMAQSSRRSTRASNSMSCGNTRTCGVWMRVSALQAPAKTVPALQFGHRNVEWRQQWPWTILAATSATAATVPHSPRTRMYRTCVRSERSDDACIARRLRCVLPSSLHSAWFSCFPGECHHFNHCANLGGRRLQPRGVAGCSTPGRSIQCWDGTEQET